MKVLITGGLGFIGVNFTKFFLGKYKNDELVIVDKLTYAANKKMLDQFKNFSTFSFYKGDISDYSFLEKVFRKEKFDYVINFAAETSVDKSFMDEATFFETNVLGVINLATLCLKYNVKRLHQVSTDEIYGDLDVSSDYYFKETDSFNPKNPYALSKAQAEEFLMMYHKVHGLNVTISRSTNNFGKYQASDKLIPLVINRALNNMEIPVFGDGKNVRDWIYVLDHCKAIDLIIKNGKSGEAYNVSSHEPHQNLELIKFILQKMRKKESLIKFVEDRKIHDRKYAVDTSKIEKELGYRHDYDFEYAIDLTIDYYRGK